MTPDEIEAVLQAAFNQCERAACPLDEQQKQILRQHFQTWTIGPATVPSADLPDRSQKSENPLAQLTMEERQTLLKFIRHQEQQQRDWKITLLNDWLQGQDSGQVQFIRERYGMQWLEQVQPNHLKYYSDREFEEVLRLKVGDRIEVTNGLWEWVQEEGPCQREWFPCTVLSVQEAPMPATAATEGAASTNCIVRFDSGAEYEIQGVYDWNRPNWRWLSI